jgi:hypothetical protein
MVFMSKITVQLSAPQYAALARISEKLGINRTHLVRLALARFFAKEDRPAAETQSTPRQEP